MAKAYREEQCASRNRRTGGFTLMEVLIVIAIIAVLVAIAIPVFSGQLERAKRGTDMANVRGAYASAMMQRMMSSGDDDVTYVFDPGAGTVVDSASAGNVSPYGQWEKEADYEVSGIDVSGIASRGGVIAISFVQGSNEPTIKWGLSVIPTWSGLFSRTTLVDGWQNASDGERKSAYKQIYDKIRETSNDTRIESDKEIVSALADYFTGMSAGEAKKILGDVRYNKMSKNQEDSLFEYAVDKSGSIRINNLDTDYVPYFDYLGFDAQVASNNELTDGYKSTSNGRQVFNYTNKFLFTSDQMIGNTFGEGETTHQIKMKFKIDDDGNLKDVSILVPGVDVLTN